MIEVEHHFDLPVPAAQAFDLLADPRRDTEWQNACTGVELLAAPSAPAPPGAPEQPRYRITFELLGKRMQFGCVVDCHQRPTHYGFRVVEGPFVYRGDYALADHEAGCRVHWRFQAEPGRFFGLLPAGLLRKVVLSQFEGDVTRLRRQLLAR